MDYSLLLIKARNPDFKKKEETKEDERKLIRMPALVYVRSNDGDAKLKLIEKDNI
jgi:hypothetical protein